MAEIEFMIDPEAEAQREQVIVEKKKAVEKAKVKEAKKFKANLMSAPEVSDKPIDTFGIEHMFSDPVEKEFAKSTIKNYLTGYQMESPAEILLLKQLVNLQVVSNRLQTELNDSHQKSSIISEKVLKTIHSNLEQMVSLTEKLGINKGKQDNLKSDGYKALETLIKKAEKWRENNQLSRTMTCPHCGKSALLKMRMEAWETLKHPYIKDRMILNDTLLTLLGNGRITTKEFADVLGTSEDYIYWAINKLSSEDKSRFNVANLKAPEITINDTDNN